MFGSIHAPLLGLARECARSLPNELAGWLAWYKEQEKADREAAEGVAMSSGAATPTTHADRVKNGIAMVQLLSAPIPSLYVPRPDHCPPTMPWCKQAHHYVTEYHKAHPAGVSPEPLVDDCCRSTIGALSPPSSCSSSPSSSSSTLTPCSSPSSDARSTVLAPSPAFDYLTLDVIHFDQDDSTQDDTSAAKMPREPTRAQMNGLEYVANKPSFLQNFGYRPPRADEYDGCGDGGRGGDLPSRPKEGKWAGGSDDEGDDTKGEVRDEWDEMYGGGEDGPQVVVLKEGRHLSADELARERRKAAGLPSPPPVDADEKPKPAADAAKKQRPTPAAGHKRKLVGEAVAAASTDDGASGKKKKKAKKASKNMLSFNEAEGEE